MLTKQDMIAYFEKGCKDPHDFKIGLEIEYFIYALENDTPVRRLTYHEGIQDILAAFQRYGFQLVYEKRSVIGATHGHISITLEPGGQLEFSSAQHKTLESLEAELSLFQTWLDEIASHFNISFVSTGYDPLGPVDVTTPKERYTIMKRYMPTVGSHGLDMMTRTCTIQVNLDYASESDMARKMRVAMCLEPFIMAFFAHSPVHDGTTPFKSYRTHIWHHTDPKRSGLLSCVFDNDFGFEKYVDYLLDVPMYFIKRHNNYQDVYHDMTHHTFRDFYEGQTPPVTPYGTPTLDDFIIHTTTVFPEVRLKPYLEIRGADGGPQAMSLCRTWVSILYDRVDEFDEITRTWTFDDINALYHNIPTQGTEALFQGKSIAQWLQAWRLMED